MPDWSTTEIKAGMTESLVIGFPKEELEIDEERTIGQDGQPLDSVPGYEVQEVGQESQSGPRLCKIVLSSPAEQTIGFMIRRTAGPSEEAQEEQGGGD